MKVLLIVAAALCLASCDRKASSQMIAACELEATRLYPGQVLETSTQVGDYMRTCMAAKGFAFDVRPETCIVPSLFMERQPGCYRPAKD
jgi:hypothetical protein